MVTNNQTLPSAPSATLHDLIARLDYETALNHLNTHPHESRSIRPVHRPPSSLIQRSHRPHRSHTTHLLLHNHGLVHPSIRNNHNYGLDGNYPLGEAYRRCLTSHPGSIFPPPPFSFIQRLVELYPEAVSFPIIQTTTESRISYSNTGYSTSRLLRTIQTIPVPPPQTNGFCHGFTPLHAVCFLLSRYSPHSPPNTTTQNDTNGVFHSLEASLDTMLRFNPTAARIPTVPRGWLPLHAACFGAGLLLEGRPPEPPRVDPLKRLVEVFPEGVVVENGGGVCPLTMFWEKYCVGEGIEFVGSLERRWVADDRWDGEVGEEEKEEFRREFFVNVQHPEPVWQVLCLMLRAVYRTRLHEQGDVVANKCGVEIIPELPRSFHPLLVIAGLREATIDMMRFAIDRTIHGTNNNTSPCSSDNGDNNDDEQRIPTDEHGNTPLHIATSLCRNSYLSSRCTDLDAITTLLSYDPTMAGYKNHFGEYPVTRAVRTGNGWDDGVEVLIKAFPGALHMNVEEGEEENCLVGRCGRRECLFMVAAVTRNGESMKEEEEEEELRRLDLRYRLLRANPEAVRCGMV